MTDLPIACTLSPDALTARREGFSPICCCALHIASSQTKDVGADTRGLGVCRTAIRRARARPLRIDTSEFM